jgi:hypothetical protein
MISSIKFLLILSGVPFRPQNPGKVGKEGKENSTKKTLRE